MRLSWRGHSCPPRPHSCGRAPSPHQRAGKSAGTAGKSARATLALLLLLEPALAQRPLGPAESQILESAREFALQYSASLPNFLCTQIVRRSENLFGGNRWRPIDVLKINLSYSGREEYKLMERNGQPTLLEYRFIGGTISSGEFGTRLKEIFTPASAAQFAWRGWSRVRGRRAAIFTYAIAKEHSRYVVEYGTGSATPHAIVAGYHGEVSVDPESSAVLRVTLVCDLPRGFGITGCNSWTEYDYRKVAGEDYLLPVESETTLATSGRYKSANRILFQDYRKFQTEATITFK